MISSYRQDALDLKKRKCACDKAIKKRLRLSMNSAIDYDKKLRVTAFVFQLQVFYQIEGTLEKHFGFKNALWRGLENKSSNSQKLICIVFVDVTMIILLEFVGCSIYKEQGTIKIRISP